MKAKRDLYAEVTDKVVKALETGSVPWIKPWAVRRGGRPVNAITKKPYRGVNVMILWAEAGLNGYIDDLWMTFKQGESMGAYPRKGEKGVTCVYYKMMQKVDEESGETKSFPMLKGFTLFNISQFDGVPEEMLKKPLDVEWCPVDEAEAVIARHNPIIEHGGDRAFYRPSTDMIRMPEKGAFKSAEAYYATLLHELGHWTGHPSRLDRDQSGQFGSVAYAFEELVAEMTSAFLCASVGLDAELQHPQYIQSWIKRLKEDKRELFKAVKLAEQASDFILVDEQADAEEDSEAKAA